MEILCQKLGQRLNDRQSTQTRMRMVAGGSALPLTTPNKEQNSTTTAMGKIGHMSIGKRNIKKGAPKTPKGGPIKDGPITSRGKLKNRALSSSRAPSPSTIEFRIQLFEFFSTHPETTTRARTSRFGSARSAIIGK